MNRRQRTIRRAEIAFEKAYRAAKRAARATIATKQGPGFIYFIGAYGSGPEMRIESVKIGWTAMDPHGRLRTLRVANSNNLELLGAVEGSQTDERRLHGNLWSEVLRGEWFALTRRTGMALWCLGIATARPPDDALEKRTREQLAWIIGRKTYEDVIAEASERAFAKLRCPAPRARG